MSSGSSELTLPRRALCPVRYIKLGSIVPARSVDRDSRKAISTKQILSGTSPQDALILMVILLYWTIDLAMLTVGRLSLEKSRSA